MALQEYARLPVFIDQAYVTQLTSVELTGESGQVAVDLLNEGLGGFTPGSGRCRIRIGFAVPIGGQEIDVWGRMKKGMIVSMQVGVGSVGYAGKGKIMSVSISQSTNASVEGTCEWEGELKDLE